MPRVRTPPPSPVASSTALGFRRAHRPKPLPFDPALHLPPVIGCAALWSATHVWRLRRPPMSVVWSEVDEHGRERVNRVDRWVRHRAKWHDTMRARRLSNVLAHGLVPVGAALLAFLSGRRARHGPLADVAVVYESLLYAGAVSQAVKLLTRRQRPFARFVPEGSAAPAKQPDDDNLSFFSSHTSTTFAAAFAAHAIACRRGVRGPTWLLGVGALLTGYLRMAADRHYLTDVVCGATVGATVGTLAPRLLHPA